MTREELIQQANQKYDQSVLIANANKKWDQFNSKNNEPIIQEQHPDVGVWDRFVLKNLDANPEQSAKYLQEKYPYLETKINNDQTLVRRKGEKDWKVIDPDTGFFSKDILSDVGDVVGMVPEGAAQILSTAAGGAVGALAGGVGVLPGAIAGGAAGAGGVNSAKQGIRQALGMQDSFNTEEALINTAIGGAMTPLAGGAGSASKIIKNSLMRNIADKGIVGTAGSDFVNKVLPKVAEVATGIPSKVFKYSINRPDKVNQVAKDPLVFAGKVADKFINNTDQLSQKYSPLVAKVVEQAKDPKNIDVSDLEFVKKNLKIVSDLIEQPKETGEILVNALEDSIKAKKDSLRPAYKAISQSDIPLNISSVSDAIKGMINNQKNISNKVKGNKALQKSYDQLKKIHDDFLTKEGPSNYVSNIKNIDTGILDEYGKPIFRSELSVSKSKGKNVPIGNTSLDVAYSLKKVLGDIIDAQGESSVGKISKSAAVKAKNELDDLIGQAVGGNKEWTKINNQWSNILNTEEDLARIVGDGTKYNKSKGMISAIDKSNKDPILKQRLLEISNGNGIDINPYINAKKSLENLGNPSKKEIDEFMIKTAGVTTKEAQDEYQKFLLNYKNQSNLYNRIKDPQPEIRAQKMIEVLRDASQKGNLADYPSDIMDDSLAFQTYEQLHNPSILPSWSGRYASNLAARAGIGAGIGGASGGGEGALYGAGLGALTTSPAALKTILKLGKNIEKGVSKSRASAGIRALVPQFYNNRGE